ncbi:MAG: hypothetical protein QOE33_2065, partial [Acidobacteriota bacterium]|nr:hypothetical protein [Acidobacteriota bacterium]
MLLLSLAATHGARAQENNHAWQIERAA